MSCAVLLPLSSVEEDVPSLLSFLPQLLVEACVRWLKIIVPNYEGSHVIPEAMSAKYQMCMDLANSIKHRYSKSIKGMQG